MRVAAEADARIAIAAAPTNYAAFKALAVALGKKSRFARHFFCSCSRQPTRSVVVMSELESRSNCQLMSKVIFSRPWS